MQLRRWQSEAIDSALNKYQSGHPHFLCLATPGAGKTIMASLVAQKLMELGDIDLVFCFSPSVNISTSFQSSLERHLNGRMDGRLGSKGQSLTYQSMLNLDESFWSLMNQFRTLLIFDEIHHCAGSDLGNANAWGEKIIQYIQGKATYTLALTGTPWRSDKTPIALSAYCHKGKVQCDYRYGLGEAVNDRVCRTPNITAIDNGDIRLSNGSEASQYNSIAHLLSSSNCAYQDLLENTELIIYLLKKSNQKLDDVRRFYPEAAGLIVAASVEHALKIEHLLRKACGVQAYIATYLHDDSQEIIRHFRETHDKWIISVGMISEGTDIPRLRVCCHLTRVKTELYFRQVLGRILRSGGGANEQGYLFMPAEPNLVEYAQRVAEDVPDTNTIKIETMASEGLPIKPSLGLETDKSQEQEFELSLSELSSTGFENPVAEATTNNMPPPPLPETYDTAIGLFGRFRQQIINLSI